MRRAGFFLMFLVISITLLYSQRPHPVIGVIQLDDSSYPNAENLYFRAFITARPSDTLTVNDEGCNYTESSGIWLVECGNFSDQWEVGETLHVDFTYQDTMETLDGFVEIELTSDNYQQAPLLVITPQPWGDRPQIDVNGIFEHINQEGNHVIEDNVKLYNITEYISDADDNIHRVQILDFDNDKLQSVEWAGTTNANGIIISHIYRITPVANENGSAQATILISDRGHNDTTLVIDFTIDPVNDLPEIIWSNPEITFDEDTSYEIYLNQFAYDIDNITGEYPNTLTWSFDGFADTLILDHVFTPSTGRLYITPRPNAFGDIITQFTLDDGTAQASVYVPVTINNINDHPVLDPIGNHTVNEIDTLIIIMGASDIDNEFHELIFYCDELPDGATIEGNIFTWVPSGFQQGHYDLSIWVADGIGGLDFENISIDVNNVNVAPIPNPDSPSHHFVTNEDIPVTFNLSDYFIDYDYNIKLNLCSFQGENITVDFTSYSSPTIIPDANWFGEEFFTISAADTQYTTIDTFSISVISVNDEPILRYIDNQFFETNYYNEFSIGAIDVDNSAEDLTFGVQNAPPGSSLNDTIFSWNPANEQEGDYQVVFFVTDDDLSDYQTVFISVGDNIDFPPSPLYPDETVVINMEEDTPYFLNLYEYFTDPDGDSLLFDISDMMPENFNITITDSGAILYPAANWYGSEELTFSATDKILNPRYVFQDFLISVSNVNDPPLFPISDTTVAGIENSYIATPVAVEMIDGLGEEVAFSFYNLPTGAYFENDSVKWVPTYFQSGLYTSYVIATDGLASDTLTIRFDIENNNRKPFFTQSHSDTLVIPEGSNRHAEVIATDLDVEALSISCVNLPPTADFFIHFEAFPFITGYLEWFPDYDDHGYYELIIKVTDIYGGADSTMIPVLVGNENQLPVITPVADTSVYETGLLEFYIEANDPDTDDTLIFLSNTLPEGAFLNPISGQFSWIPSAGEAGEYYISIDVFDGRATATIDFEVNVLNTLLTGSVLSMEGLEENVNVKLINIEEGSLISETTTNTYGRYFFGEDIEDIEPSEDIMLRLHTDSFESIYSSFASNGIQSFYLSTIESPPNATNFICTYTNTGETLLKNWHLLPGDRIKAYDPQGVLCGATTISLDGSINLMVFGDDSSTGTDEGASEGDIIHFLFQDYSITNEEGNQWHSDAEIYQPFQFWPYEYLNNVFSISRKNNVFAAYPNPFNPKTTFNFSIRENSSYCSLKVYNVKGQLVGTLLDDEIDSGQHTITWDGTNNASCSVSSGIYFVMMEIQSPSGSKESFVQKITLIK